MFKLNQNGSVANKLGTGEWHNVESSVEYLAWLAEGNTPEPADPVPNPRIAAIHAELEALDRKSIRALREGDAARIADIESQAEALRVELRSL